MTTTKYTDARHAMLALIAGGAVTIEPEQVAVGDHVKITSPWHADGRKLDDQTSADELLLCDLVDIDLPTGRTSLTRKGQETLAALTGSVERGFRHGTVITLRTATCSHLVVSAPGDPVAMVGTVCSPAKLPKRYTFDLVPTAYGAVCNRCNGVNPYGSGGRR
jgi:hypothetical protein